MGGRLPLQCAKCPLVPVDGAAEAKREPRDLPGRPRGSPASQGDDSASDFDLKAVPGRATTVVSCPTEPERM
jgi:hypothetical protein